MMGISIVSSNLIASWFEYVVSATAVFLKFVKMYFTVYSSNFQNTPCVIENNMYILILIIK